MKYSLDAAAAEIDRRRRKMIYRKKRRNVAGLTAVTVLTALLFVIALYRQIGFTLIDSEASVYGSFMLPDEAGGYILVGVVCFVAAVVITLICIRYGTGKGSRTGHGLKEDKQKNSAGQTEE